MCVATPHIKAESPQEVNCAWENTSKMSRPAACHQLNKHNSSEMDNEQFKTLRTNGTFSKATYLVTWYLNALLIIFRRSILTVTDYEITCLCLAGLVPSCEPNFEPRPRASSEWEGSNPLILTKFREQGLFPMLGKPNLFTSVALQCEFFTNSVEQFVFIWSEEIQLCDSPEEIHLLQLFGGTLQCSGGVKWCDVPHTAANVPHLLYINKGPNTAVLYNATVNMCTE
jgi:hypothetical protein